MSTPSLREQIAEAIIQTIQTNISPRVALATREPFEPDKIAITQFPAVLVQMNMEARETITMGQPQFGRRMGTIIYTLRGYVRGTELDARRNELITGLETVLDADRYLGLRESGVIDSQLVKIEIKDRLPPLAEVNIEFHVKYNYVRGSA